MAIYTPSFIFGLAVVLYLSTFIVFAVLRILTGISIQRLGYFSLRHINYTPRDGLRIEIRGLGLNVHRPTFAQPTWLSVVITDLNVTIDPKVALESSASSAEEVSQAKANLATAGGSINDDEDLDEEIQRSRIWKSMTRLKERLKKLHRRIKWLRMVDLVATNTSVKVVNVCNMQFGNFTMAVDTRRKTVDRSRLFQHMRSTDQSQRPAEWILTLRSVLFTAEGKESLEVLDYGSLNVYGILYNELDGLRDAAVVLKLGRLNIPYDDIQLLSRSFHRRSHSRKSSARLSQASNKLEGGPFKPDRAERLVQAFSDSNEFINSVLRGIQEVQFAVGFLAVTKEINPSDYPDTTMFLNLSLKEFGIDMHRLDQKSPAHRMYFSRDDVAHQALLAAISITASLDDGEGKPERLLYIPMVTTTIKTTLPSKTVQMAEEKSFADRNANILFANVVVTSPSIDLRPHHLPILLDLATPNPPARPSYMSGRKHFVISRLLPKANIRFSIHEPVLRVVLPCLDKSLKDTDEFDLLVSSISSISLDMESSHSAGGDIHYSLVSNFRVSTHELYYQAASGMRHDLLLTDALEIKVQVSASPEVHVVIHGNLQTFTVHMVRPETSQGVRQVFKHIRSKAMSAWTRSPRKERKTNFLRSVPAWLLHVRLEGKTFGVEIAGVDPDVSKNSKGFALQLDSWTAEYRAQNKQEPAKMEPRKRAMSRVLGSDDELHQLSSIEHRSPDGTVATDGRRLALHVYGLEGYVVESMERWEPETFLSVPRLEVAFNTSSDHDGPIFHVNTLIKSISLQYSLYRHYALSVAIQVLHRTFSSKSAKDAATQMAAEAVAATFESNLPPSDRKRSSEFVNADIKISKLQVKAHLPSDPPLLLQVFSLDACRRRFTVPFVKAAFIRLCAAPPRTHKSWARILTLKQVRVDLRTVLRKSKTESIEQRSIDISSEAVRAAVPNQVVIYKIVDNIINTTKAVQQLQRRSRGGSCEPVDKLPEGPKVLPRISFRATSFLMEMEDNPFEWKLGSIYRAGLKEQKQRIAREEAFNAKVEKLKATNQPLNRRARSAHPRGRTRGSIPQDKPRSKSVSDPRGRSRSRSPGDVSGRPELKYDPEGVIDMSTSASVGLDAARLALDEYNARSWRRTIDNYYTFQRERMQKLRTTIIGQEGYNEPPSEDERLLEMPARPSLAAITVSDLHLVLDKPSFPVNEYAKFLYRVGKQIPHDTKYCLLVPMHVKLDVAEVRLNLRDYPLPLIHVPGIQASQSPRIPSWILETDFVIAEEYRDIESSRLIKLEVVPPEERGGQTTSGFSIDVRRTVSPVKTYSDLNISINTAYPTRITWGTAYQPAIQDMMMVIENFTKPQIDPSDRAGFWDKIRLVFHSRAKVSWKADGDVHLVLLGSRDPYVITGYGAGFVMCWRNDVTWTINADPDPRKFMTVDASEYILAVPDFSSRAISLDNRESSDTTSLRSTQSYRDGAQFKKVIMKLSGNVRWLAGLMFERNLPNGQRSFDSKPHYDITLKDPQFAKGVDGRPYDAFEGFRSQYIHLSLAVIAPLERDWSASNLTPSQSYNTIHLSPRFFTHFFNWWSLFSGAMALPVRQGKLWPGVEKSSKKFGRHLTTIKYNILLSPLYISHVYKHKETEDDKDSVVSATGLKAKLDCFIVDVHQRREEHMHQSRGRAELTKISSMNIHEAEVDLVSADLRAIAATISGAKMDEIKQSSESQLKTHADHALALQDSKFTVPDMDYTWIDLDDFVEIDWLLPSEWNEETKIMPLAFTPRFTYFRQTDHSTELERTINHLPRNTFGHEATHQCVMNEGNGPGLVQSHLVQQRLDHLEEQISSHRRLVGEYELKRVRDGDTSHMQNNHQLLENHGDVLEETKVFLENMKKRYDRKFASGVSSSSTQSLGSLASSSPESKSLLEAEAENNPLADFATDFNNRFIVHNLELKWNNVLRNITLRYIHQSSQRRGFIYYMSRRAVKFILDVIAEQNKAKAPRPKHQRQSPSTSNATGTPTQNAEHDPDDVRSRINQLLDDVQKVVSESSLKSEPGNITIDNLSDNAGKHNTALNAYQVRLIAPQVQMQSERNTDAAVLLTAKGIQLKVVEIMDKERLFDDISGLVQRRFAANLDSVQFFVTNRMSGTIKQAVALSGSTYGAPAGTSWPPWVPIENMLDFRHDPFGFCRVVRKTSASLRYFKHNALRLKYNDEISKDGTAKGSASEESQVDEVFVNFPEIKALCDSGQYAAMYVIVLDLLLYSEPLEKVRSERLEKIMLASDFSDLTGAPEAVMRLQDRIRQLEAIKSHLQLHSENINKRGWEARLLVERDLANFEDELFFMMKAITSAQRKHEDMDGGAISLLKWYLSSNNIVWHLVRGTNEPLAEFQLANAAYERIDQSDGSNTNTLQISKINGLNLLSNATYPNMIGPYLEDASTQNSDLPMLNVSWKMLEAIAGIPVMDHFEIKLFPLKVQLEKEAGKKIFEYVFPGSNENSELPIAVLANGGASSLVSPGVETATPKAEGDNYFNMPGHTKHDSVALRLRPTLHLTPHKNASSQHGHNHHHGFGHKLKMSHASNEPVAASPFKHQLSTHSILSLQKKRSGENLSVPTLRTPERSATSLSMTPSTTTVDKSGKPQKKSLLRTNTSTKRESDKNADDLSKMMSRASNYMTLAHIKIPSVVLCVSYKGKGERNFEDVHNFVFRMPALEYYNKTWSNLDLALQLKREVYKALFSHTGAIIGNKFTHKRPKKPGPSHLRDIANSSQMIADDETGADRRASQHVRSETGSSLYTGGSSELQESPRSSFGLSRQSSVMSHTSLKSLDEQTRQRASMEEERRRRSEEMTRPSTTDGLTEPKASVTSIATTKTITPANSRASAGSSATLQVASSPTLFASRATLADSEAPSSHSSLHRTITKHFSRALHGTSMPHFGHDHGHGNGSSHSSAASTPTSNGNAGANGTITSSGSQHDTAAASSNGTFEPAEADKESGAKKGRSFLGKKIFST